MGMMSTVFVEDMSPIDDEMAAGARVAKCIFVCVCLVGCFGGVQVGICVRIT